MNRAAVVSATPTATKGSLVPCGVTRSTGHYEWTCVAAVHDTEKQRSRQLDSRGNPARAERHLFVRRWPGTDR
jgi:hypothetical protein